jgi:hypothetical protein
MNIKVKGPIVGKLLEAQIQWQISNRIVDPNEENIANCLNYLQQFL